MRELDEELSLHSVPHGVVPCLTVSTLWILDSVEKGSMVLAAVVPLEDEDGAGRRRVRRVSCQFLRARMTVSRLSLCLRSCVCFSGRTGVLGRAELWCLSLLAGVLGDSSFVIYKAFFDGMAVDAGGLMVG